MSQNNKPRKPRSYKMTDALYKKAMSRAKKESWKLASLIENTIIGYANGYDIALTKPKENESAN